MRKERVQKGTKINCDSVARRFDLKLRRRKVFHFRIRAYSIRRIARALDISVNTVVADLKAIDKALQESIKETDATKILNEMLAIYDQVASDAWISLDAAKPRNKAKLLLLILRAIDLKVRLLTCAGVLPKLIRRAQVEEPTTETPRTNAEQFRVTVEYPSGYCPPKFKEINVAEEMKKQALPGFPTFAIPAVNQ